MHTPPTMPGHAPARHHRIDNIPTSWYATSMTEVRTRRLSARDKLLDAALDVIRAKGFAAMSVDELCAAAGVTKGAFFHHFDSKEALGAAAARHWSQTTAGLFADAPYHAPADPLERVLAYIAFRRALIEGPAEAFSCVAGTLVQETFAASETIRAACEAAIFDHAATLVADIEAAIASRGLTPEGWSAESLAAHTQAVLQGAFILAKARGHPATARDSVDHLDRYIRLLFAAGPEERLTP